MPVPWKETETWQRLVAAMVASGVKHDLRKVAQLFGTTYDTLDNRWRVICKEVDALKAAVESGEQEVVVATPKKVRTTKTATPKKATPKKDALNSVANGRVTKTSSAKKTKVAKAEKDGDDEGSDTFENIDFGADAGDVDMEEFLT